MISVASIRFTAEVIVEIRIDCDKLSEDSVLAALVAMERATLSGAPALAVDKAVEISSD